jgi:hypothetical protein
MSSEGEHLGIGGNEPNDELLFAAIDEEWAEFNEQLAQEVANEDGHQKTMELDEEIETITADMLERFNEYQSQSFIFHRDDYAEHVACRTYMQELYDRCLKELQYASECGADSSNDRARYVQKAVACTIAYINEKKFQQDILTYTASVEYIYQHRDELGASSQELEQTKKSGHAKLLVQHGRHMNDKSLQFYSTNRPEIEGLISESRPSDAEYIASARLDLPAYIQMQHDQTSILETSIDLVTFKSGPELWDDVEQMSVVLANVAELYLIATRPIDTSDGASRAKRNERLWKYRQNTPVGIGDEQYKELIDYFDGNYDWANENE